MIATSQNNPDNLRLEGELSQQKCKTRHDFVKSAGLLKEPLIDPKVPMTALILAGGKSLGNKTLLEALVRLTASIFSETFIISSQNENYQQFNLHGAAVLHDFLENKGPLVGLYTGLSYSTHQASCVVTCDKPLPEASLLRELAALWRDDYDAVCPEDSQGHLQPFPGIYRRASRHFIRLLLDRGETATRRLFDILVIRPLVLGKKETVSPN